MRRKIRNRKLIPESRKHPLVTAITTANRAKLDLIKALRAEIQALTVSEFYAQKRTDNNLRKAQLVLAFLEEITIIDKSRKTWRAYLPDALAWQVKRSLRDLIELSPDKNQRCSSALLEIATQATRQLNKQATKQPARFKKLGEKNQFWPVLKGRKENYGHEHKSIIRQLSVGKCCPKPTPLSSKSKKGKSTEIAIELFESIELSRTNPFILQHQTTWEMEARKLKPLSLQTVTSWFSVAWDKVLFENNNKPEKDIRLRELGKYRGNHSVNVGQQGKKATRQTEDANIRDGIKTALSSAFKRIAPIP